MDTSQTEEKTPLRALIIEDREDDALLLMDKLQRGGYVLDADRVDNPDSLNTALEKNWDIIFCDYSMPTMTGVDALKLVRKSNADVPFIFVSGTIGEDVAVEAMRNGAKDYIMKDNLKRLLPAVARELQDYQTRKSQRKAEQRVFQLSRYDSLTGLPNRFTFIETLNHAIKQYPSNKQLIVVVHIDIDRFKTINDSLGYEAGNQLLKEVAHRLQHSISNVTVARMAADEFAIMLLSPSADQTPQLVQKIYMAMAGTYSVYGLSLYFNASLGVSVFPGETDDAEKLLGHADVATYRLKDEGGNGILFYTPSMSVQLEERLALERNMRQALENHEYFIHYQPQLELATGNIVGVEALIRWNHPGVGLVSPADFIPLAEDTGFILPLGEWILDSACQQLKDWQSSYQYPLRVAVNVSARQFHSEELVDILYGLISKYQLAPELLEIEITESSIIRDVGKAITTLKKIQSLGIKVALDDFGTGYSSLSYLKNFKTDYLKVDQSFVREIPHNREDNAIVSAIIAMADKLSIKTIAEGVESQDQLNFLRDQGCDLIQGYLISRPLDSHALSALLAKKGEPF